MPPSKPSIQEIQKAAGNFIEMTPRHALSIIQEYIADKAPDEQSFWTKLAQKIDINEIYVKIKCSNDLNLNKRLFNIILDTCEITNQLERSEFIKIHKSLLGLFDDSGIDTFLLRMAKYYGHSLSDMGAIIGTRNTQDTPQWLYKRIYRNIHSENPYFVVDAIMNFMGADEADLALARKLVDKIRVATLTNINEVDLSLIERDKVAKSQSKHLGKTILASTFYDAEAQTWLERSRHTHSIEPLTIT